MFTNLWIELSVRIENMKTPEGKTSYKIRQQTMSFISTKSEKDSKSKWKNGLKFNWISNLLLVDVGRK